MVFVVKEWPFLCTKLSQMQLHNMVSFDLRDWKPLRCNIALFFFHHAFHLQTNFLNSIDLNF